MAGLERSHGRVLQVVSTKLWNFHGYHKLLNRAVVQYTYER
jgi:hypothetical protein